jgi:hypothetical protein
VVGKALCLIAVEHSSHGRATTALLMPAQCDGRACCSQLGGVALFDAASPP